MTSSTVSDGPRAPTDNEAGCDPSTDPVRQECQSIEWLADITISDGHIKIPEYRLQAYKLSVDGRGSGVGLCPTYVARTLHVTKQTVSDHLDWLESYRFIEKEGKTKPQFYCRGKYARILDRAYNEWKSGNYEESVDGRSWILSQVVIEKHRLPRHDAKPVLSRSHLNGRVHFEVHKKGDMGRIPNVRTGGNNERPVFDKDPYNTHNGVDRWKGRVQLGDVVVPIEYAESKNVQTLSVWPPAFYLGPDKLDDAEAMLMERAREAVEPLQANGGWIFGPPKLRGKVEHATTDERIMSQIPDACPTPSKSALWVDRSTGVPEIETSDTAAAKPIFDFPNVTRQINARMNGLELSQQMDHQMIVESRRLYDELAYRTSKLREAAENIERIEEIRLRLDLRHMEGQGVLLPSKTNDANDQGGMYR